MQGTYTLFSLFDLCHLCTYMYTCTRIPTYVYVFETQYAREERIQNNDWLSREECDDLPRPVPFVLKCTIRTKNQIKYNEKYGMMKNMVKIG